jgi:hypothetical protein
MVVVAMIVASLFQQACKERPILELVHGKIVGDLKKNMFHGYRDNHICDKMFLS